MPITSREAELLAWLDAQYQPMVELLGELVDTDSGSLDKAGVDRAGKILQAHLEARGVACEVTDHPAAGFFLQATVPPLGNANDHVLLLGHRDTIFPKDTAKARPFRVEGRLGYGPGVSDMKAGLVMNAFVLEAFARVGGAVLPLVGLFTSDEEIASPASRPVIEAAARGARAVFNAEPGRAAGPGGPGSSGGNVVSGRKGAMFLTVEVTGIPAHSGGAHDKGVSAIEELCRKVTSLHALTDYASGTTVNVGLIEGGVSINTVAPWAKARVDVRFKTLAAMAAAEVAVQKILETVHLVGTTTRLAERAAFLPLEQTPANRALFEHYVSCAADLGLTIGGEYTGGSADSGYTSAIGAPTLCGTGPIGAKAHTPDEVCELDSLPMRAKALALAIMRLPA
jgi:glutamate carboxypeptidase